MRCNWHRIGATVIATASGHDEAYLKFIGASRVIDYREAQFEKVLRRGSADAMQVAARQHGLAPISNAMIRFFLEPLGNVPAWTERQIQALRPSLAFAEFHESLG